MGDEVKHDGELTDAEIRAAWSSSECVACDGAAKSRVAPFCKSCTLALTLWVRNSLATGPDDPRFFETFRGALKHLRLHASRIKRIGGWDLRSVDEIEAAGYKYLNMSRCRASGCNEQIAWFEDELGTRIPVNVSDCQPHRTTCKNPGNYRRVRTSALHRRGGRR